MSELRWPGAVPGSPQSTCIGTRIWLLGAWERTERDILFGEFNKVCRILIYIVIIHIVAANVKRWICCCRGEALQSIVQLMAEKELYQYWSESYKTHSIGWSVEKAKAVLEAWQRKFTQVVNNAQNGTNGNEIYGFSSVSLADIMKEFSSLSPTRVALGYVLMVSNNTVHDFTHFKLNQIPQRNQMNHWAFVTFRYFTHASLYWGGIMASSPRAVWVWQVFCWSRCRWQQDSESAQCWESVSMPLLHK